jgi:lipoprotein signal peptidase
MTDRSFRGLFFALALAGLLLDQASKYLAFDRLRNASPYYIVEGVFHLEANYNPDKPGSPPMVNQGALFGFLRDHGEIANGLFAAVSIGAAAAIIFWATLRSTSRDWSLSAALGLILAGTLGNLYDRIVFAGVRDFLHFHYRSFDWPVFNVADVCLVCGAFLLLTQALFSRTPADRPVLEMRQPVEMK